MHKHMTTINGDSVRNPIGEICIVYFSSATLNTKRFVEKLGFKSFRLPYNPEETIEMKQNYVLINSTYCGGGEFTYGAVPKQVIKFLNNKTNREHCYGVLAGGNTNFGNTFALAGPIVSKKLNVPLLYQFELAGTLHDVEIVQKILKDFWK